MQGVRPDSDSILRHLLTWRQTQAGVTLEGLSLRDRFRPLSLQGLSLSKAGLPLLPRVATATVPAEINTLRKYPGQSCGPWPVEPSLLMFVSRSVYITYYVLQFQ